MNMYCEEIISKEFRNEISKQAYLDACKWLAKNVVGKKVSQYTSYKIIKKEKEKIPTFEVKIFMNVEAKELNEGFCKHCKMIYSAFYQVDKINCNDCKFNAYKKKMQNSFNTMKDFVTKQIEGDEE